MPTAPTNNGKSEEADAHFQLNRATTGKFDGEI